MPEVNMDIKKRIPIVVMCTTIVLKLITWIAINFLSDLTKIDIVKAFHCGTDLLVEVNIGLSGNLRIQQAHDIGTNLQVKLESLSESERAFVYIDYKFHHKVDEHKTNLTMY
ncbi:unnamed protein product [Rotaria sp. Silwood2]|nr:unnamed protein product [Rotaria sp. Silwood2]CAF2844591.1 unnamed protein product [Rotaria sp. Silwood2]CAF3328498.1 unnamed protein product [Rotaria sp. Silwood2]CAF4116631.1 unnamed protein product [Rotaria sp. Silwood2]CAF4157667.1 unnamed protein product [Rotaria sp. Silwood2]